MARIQSRRAGRHEAAVAYAVAYAASLLWLAASLLLGVLSVLTSGVHGWAVASCGAGVSWLLGLLALAHRRAAWPLVAWETAALCTFTAAWLACLGA